MCEETFSPNIVGLLVDIGAFLMLLWYETIDQSWNERRGKNQCSWKYVQDGTIRFKHVTQKLMVSFFVEKVEYIE